MYNILIRVVRKNQNIPFRYSVEKVAFAIDKNDFKIIFEFG